MSIWRISFLSILLVGSLALPAPATTLYDMWDYMVNDHASSSYLTGTHDLRTFYRDNDKILLIKNRRGYPFEVFFLFGNQINLKYESGGYFNPNDGLWYNNFSKDNFRYYDDLPGFRWTPRYVESGKLYGRGSMWEYYDNQDTFPGQWRKRICGGYIRPVHKTSVSVGGDLGSRTDVIELNFYGSTVDENNKEKYFYDREYGLILWQFIKDGQVTSSSFFNRVVPGTFTEEGRWPFVTGHGFPVFPGCSS